MKDRDVLNPESVLVDDRNISDFILLIQKISQKLNFYNHKNKIDGNFSEVIDSDETFLLSEISKYPIQSFTNIRLNLISQFDNSRTIKEKIEVLNGYIEITDSLFIQISRWYNTAKRNNLSYASSPIEKELEFSIVNKGSFLLSDYFKILNILLKRNFIKTASIESIENQWAFIWNVDISLLRIQLSENDNYSNTTSLNLLNLSIKKIILISSELYELNYNLINKASELFPRSLENSNHKAHIGLLLSFLKLFEHIQLDLNKFSKRHIDYYYQKVLRQEKKKIDPLETFVYAETDSNKEEIFLAKNTIVLAGQYEEGLPLKFKFKNDLRANSLKISFLSTIYASRNNLFDFDSKFSLVTSIYHKIIADNIDEVQQFNTNTSSFSALGSEQDFLTKFESNMDKANIGFMISSHVLKLSSSERKIKLILDFLPSSIFLFSDLIIDIVENTKLSELDIFNKIFSKAFDVSYTTIEGWHPIKDYEIIPPVDWSSGRIEIHMNLSSLDPGFVGYNEKNHLLNINSDYPVIRFNLNQNDFYNAYSFLSVLELSKLEIKIQVNKLRNFKIFTGGQTLDSNSEFNFFGPTPRLGNKLYLCCEELFNKKIEFLKIKWEYSNLPSGFKNLEEYYENYGNNIFDLSFKYELTALSDFRYSGNQNSQSVYPLFEIDDQNNISKSSILELSNLNFLKIKPNYNLSNGEIQRFSNKLETGILRFELKSPSSGFGVDLYPIISTKLLTDKVLNPKNNDEDKTVQLPYVPKVDHLDINYNTSTTIYFTDKDRRQNNNKVEDRVFSYSPYGIEEIFSKHLITKNNLFYKFPNEGEFIIGFNGEKSFSELSVLFEIIKSNNASYDFSNDISWYYTSHQGWKLLEKENILSDETQNLLTTGIITFKFPSDLSSNSGILKRGNYYLKACSKDRADQFGLIKSVRTNAVKIIETIPLEHITRKNSIKANSVEGFENKINGITSLKQPFSSRIPGIIESDNDYYLRVSHLLRHKNRPVSFWDYEYFIINNFNWISHVRCLQINSQTKKTNVQIMCFKKIEEHQNIEEVMLSIDEMNQIKNYLNQNISPFVKIEFVNAVFEELWVKCKLKFKNVSTGNGIQKFNQDFFEFICSWSFGFNQSTQNIPKRIKKIDIIKFVKEREYIEFVTGISFIHLSRNADNKISVYDSAVTENDHEEYIYIGTNKSVFVPRNRHNLEIIDSSDYHAPEPTDFNELQIDSSFALVSEETNKVSKKRTKKSTKSDSTMNSIFTLDI
tara:strand:+ start:13233 stop:16985 length:3753 start_codon:yes stop_codon:yes gene_type:complete